MANREKGTADADKYSELIQVLVKPARLLGRQQILKEKLSEVKKLRSEIAELEAIKQSLQEVQ